MRRIEIPCTEAQKQKIIDSIWQNLNKNGGLTVEDICEIFDEEDDFDDSSEVFEILKENIICVKPPRWRADKNGEYFYVNHIGNVICGIDEYIAEDNTFYNSGNYFKTDMKAEVYAEKWRALFSENGRL